MPGFPDGLNRRRFLASLAAAGTVIPLATRPAVASGSIRTRPIPATGEEIPTVGMGSWQTFNVGGTRLLRDHRVEVLRTFFDMGGGTIDSSPMYGSSEEVIGYCLSKLGPERRLFSATKVWTPVRALGVRQMATSRKLWRTPRFDLMQIHNLLNWEGHLETLLADKEAGKVRYLGITTSHGRRHEMFEKVMTTRPLEFVQFTYNILDRRAERRLLPVAAERGLAVIVNRPFRRGALIRRVSRHPLPDWAKEIDCANWAQFLLKFIVSHPGVTCVIPATSRIDHMRENMGAMRGRLPDRAMRERMVGYVESL